MINGYIATYIKEETGQTKIVSCKKITELFWTSYNAGGKME
jgi:hypothetical protein